MTQDVIVRPEPAGTNRRGRPFYDPEDLAAFRMASGVYQAEVAKAAGWTQALVSYLESTKARVNRPMRQQVEERQALVYMTAVEKLARTRARVMDEGLALMERRAGEREAAS